MQVVFLFVCTAKAPGEGRGIEPEHIISRQQRREHTHPIIYGAAPEGGREDLIFGKETGEGRDTRDSDTARSGR